MFKALVDCFKEQNSKLEFNDIFNHYCLSPIREMGGLCAKLYPLLKIKEV